MFFTTRQFTVDEVSCEANFVIQSKQAGESVHAFVALQFPSLKCEKNAMMCERCVKKGTRVEHRMSNEFGQLNDSMVSSHTIIRQVVSIVYGSIIVVRRTRRTRWAL